MPPLLFYDIQISMGQRMNLETTTYEYKTPPSSGIILSLRKVFAVRKVNETVAKTFACNREISSNFISLQFLLKKQAVSLHTCISDPHLG